MAELLRFSYEKVGQPGDLVRLRATNNPHPVNGDWYPPYNKPYAISKWISSVRCDATVMIVDPDFVFTRRLHVEVEPGDAYAWNAGYLEEDPPHVARHARDLCRLQRLGVPYVVHTSDLRRLAPLWVRYTDVVRQEEVSGLHPHYVDGRDWCADMYGYGLAANELRLPHRIDRDLVAIPDEDRTAPLIHYYATSFSLEGWTWRKEEYVPWTRVDYPQNTPAATRVVLDTINDYVADLASSGEAQ